MDCCKEIKEDGPRHDPGDQPVPVVAPLHKVTERSYREHNKTIRKPPLPVEQNGSTITRDNGTGSPRSISGGYTQDRKSSSLSMDGSNYGSSSNQHVVTATGNSNSSSSDDRKSEYGSNIRGSAPQYVNGDRTWENHHDQDRTVTLRQSDTKQENADGVSDPDQRHFRIKSFLNQNSIRGIEVQVAPDQDNDTCPVQKIGSIEYNEEYNSKKPPSENGSDGGYAGSASSNDVFGGSSSTSDSVSSNEGSCGSTPRRLNPKRCPVASKSCRSSSSSSEIADFSSGSQTFDSCDSKSNSQYVFKPHQRVSSGAYVIVDSSSDDSDSVPETSSTIKKRRFKSSAAKEQGVGKRFRRFPSIPDSDDLPCSKVAKRRKRSFRNHHYDNSTNTDLKESRTIGTKTTGLYSEFQKASRNEDLKYPAASKWQFIEQTINNKPASLSLLQQNFDFAIKRYIHSNSSSNESSSTPSPKTSSNAACPTDQHFHSTPIYNIGSDIMAKILTYLKPAEANRILSFPLSKTFRESFSLPQAVWKILCLSKPFSATIDKRHNGSDDSICSYPLCNDVAFRHVIGRYRLLYSSFVRCMNYLDRIKDDALNGRMPGLQDVNTKPASFSGNSSLQSFFAKASEHGRESDSDIGYSSLSSGSKDNQQQLVNSKKKSDKKVIKYAPSALTTKLLGPSSHSRIPGPVCLPIGCAVHSIVNWMVAFADVAGIQTICLHVLPILLEDDRQRTVAQSVGLTDIVLRAMVLFPNDADLHTSAFHTLVLLARPIGGKEGMIFYRAMVNASGIFNEISSTCESGIAIMMDSMKRFSTNEKLQAMSCWSMVNIALIQSQKVALVRFGGINAAGNAMMQHPLSPDVQFRALFALINLVIPSGNLPDHSLEVEAIRKEFDGVNQMNEIEMLDESVEYITNLVLQAMKNFCSNTAILNRACLVLHNLSLNTKYHNVLLWTPNCYQMIEWCIENYKEDKVLQQSARGTLQRLQMTLSNDESLRSKFAITIRAQQQSVVDSALFQNVAVSRPSQDLDEGHQSIE